MKYFLMNDGSVMRESDLALIPPTEENKDWQAYLADTAKTVEPYDYAAEEARQDAAEIVTDAKAAEKSAIAAIRDDAALSAIYNALKTASFAQIATWVDNNFSGMTVAQRAVLTLIIANTAADLRERGNR